MKKYEVEVYIASTGQAHDIDYVPSVLRKELVRIKDKRLRLQKQCLYNLIFSVFYNRFGKRLNDKSITKDKSGKPLIKGYYISCTHSKDLICVAVSENTNIGVDIEAMITKITLEKLHSKICHRNEAKFDLNLINVFYLWTRKEAIYKMISATSKLVPKKIDTTKYLTLSTIVDYGRYTYALSVAAKKNTCIHINILDTKIKIK